MKGSKKNMDSKNSYMKNEVRKFLNNHRDVEFSAAKFEYSLYLYGEAGQKMIEFADTKYPMTEADLEVKKIIAEVKNPNELLKLMRKELAGPNRSLLRQRIMEYEAELLPMIKEKSIRNKQDVFIENALHFFIKSEVNCSDWIMETYAQFQSEYLKSLFCLVLGFRGDVNMIPFLMEEAERMEKEYPSKDYDQGPVLAVQELAVRHLNLNVR